MKLWTSCDIGIENEKMKPLSILWWSRTPRPPNGLGWETILARIKMLLGRCCRARASTLLMAVQKWPLCVRARSLSSPPFAYQANFASKSEPFVFFPPFLSIDLYCGQSPLFSGAFLPHISSWCRINKCCCRESVLQDRKIDKSASSRKTPFQRPRCFEDSFYVVMISEASRMKSDVASDDLSVLAWLRGAKQGH